MYEVLHFQLRIPYWRKKEVDITFDITAHASYIKQPVWPSLDFWQNQYERGAILRLWLVFARLVFKVDFNR